MSLRRRAEQDLGVILENDVRGFGWALVLTDPDGNSSQELVGSSGDVSLLIDPETGQAVKGRRALVTLRISSLAEQGFEIPEHVSDSNERPWLVRFEDLQLNSYTFKIVSSDPDRTLGAVTCALELFSASRFD